MEFRCFSLRTCFGRKKKSRSRRHIPRYIHQVHVLYTNTLNKISKGLEVSKFLKQYSLLLRYELLCSASLELWWEHYNSILLITSGFTEKLTLPLVLSNKDVSSSAGCGFCPITPATLPKSPVEVIVHFSEDIAKGWKKTAERYRV